MPSRPPCALQIPKAFELVGLTYSGWFTYRYLLFKSTREELISVRMHFTWLDGSVLCGQPTHNACVRAGCPLGGGFEEQALPEGSLTFLLHATLPPKTAYH